jgi:putative transposase
MARPLRLEYPGALYHVTSRGNGKQRIFRNDKDRRYFLDLLVHLAQRFHFVLHAYCLMDTHYHLLVETPEGNLSKGMRQLNGVYTQKFNWKHKTTGHVFQGRYKAILVDKESYLLELARYVVLNPVRAHMVESPEDWPWSSYRATAGLVDPLPCLTTDWLLGQFSSRKKKAFELYALFVHEGITRESPWRDLKGQIFLGDQDFVEEVASSIKETSKEVRRNQRYANRPSLATLLPAGTPMKKGERDRLVSEAHLSYGYTLKELADYLHVHYATISRAVKRVMGKNV